jgi:steroid delta-isomerase-like uncharacterized protein
LLRRYFEEVWDRRDFALLDDLFAPDFVFHAPIVPGGIRGAAAYREQVIAPLLAAFPDLQFRPDAYYTDGDAVVVAWTMRGTHRGPFQGIAATDKAFAVPGMIIAHVAGDRIREIRGIFDGLGLLQQLGVVPPPSPTPAPKPPAP